jgi:hypothetical protein
MNAASPRPALRLERYAPAHSAAARAFNQRMREAGADVDFLLPEEAPAPPASSPIIRTHHLVLDGDNSARGGVIVQSQPHWIAGETHAVWNLQAPISEGVADRRYGFVAPFLLQALLGENPLLYAVGMGAAMRPFPRLLKAQRFRLREIPFRFRVCDAPAFLREIRALGASAPRRILRGVAELSGLGAWGLRALQAVRTLRPMGGNASAESMASFGSWADEVWQRARGAYRWCAVRSADVLNALYPAGRERITRLRIRSQGATIGWAVGLTTHAHDHKHFGTLRIGTIVDCLAAPLHALHVVQAAAAALREGGVQLVVTNQSHPSWVAALDRSGFLSGPSNYLCGASAALDARVTPDGEEAGIGITRGDGDGIANL